MHLCCETLAALTLAVFSSATTLLSVSGQQYFDYDEDLARLSVIYSSAAYDLNPAVANWSFVNPACNERTEGFVLNQTYVGEGTEAFAYVGLDTAGERIVVAFKGTSDLHDWVTDLRSWVRYTKRCAPDPAANRSSGTKAAAAAAAAANGALRPRFLETEEELEREGKSEAGARADATNPVTHSEAYSEEYSEAISEANPRANPRATLRRSSRRGNPRLSSRLNPRANSRAYSEAYSETYSEPYSDSETDLEEEHASSEKTEGGQDELIGNVHFGFCSYYQSVVAEGLADRVALLAQQNPTYSVFVTGHSLGAAAAAVCAADLSQRMLVEGERVVLYTLGEPRAGDGIFAEGLNDRVGTAYRVVHNRDVVPHLALCCHGWFGKCQEGTVSCPYQHSTEIVYDSDMSPGASWSVCNGTIGEDYACDPQSIDLSVSDHTHYFELLVGEYCATAPEDALAFPESQSREEARWASYDMAMRREDAPVFDPTTGGGPPIGVGYGPIFVQ